MEMNGFLSVEHGGCVTEARCLVPNVHLVEFCKGVEHLLLIVN